LYLGPVLLRRRFQNQKYYKHFIRLVRLLNVCLQFEITDDEIDEIRSGFIQWVQDYERYLHLLIYSCFDSSYTGIVSIISITLTAYLHVP
jgi:hypothetical protein